MTRFMTARMMTDNEIASFKKENTIVVFEDYYSVKDICLFISEYAAWLLGAGATCIRLERNVGRIALAFNCDAIMTIMPRHIHLTVSNLNSLDSYTCIADIRTATISFDINTKLSELSWAVADGKLDFKGAKSVFNDIISTPPSDVRMVLALASLANASFCRLFGGDWAAVVIVLFATLAGYYLKQVLCEYKTDIRLVFILCAFVSSVLGATDALFGVGSTPEIAIGTSVLYLVPGIPFLNSFSDMLAGHYICSFSRFMHAVILTACLSIGLCGGMVMMGMGMF